MVVLHLPFDSQKVNSDSMNKQPSYVIRLAILCPCLAFLCVLIVRHTGAQQIRTSPGQPALSEKTIDQVHKNIQVLKGVPESQLIPVMNYMSASLGVRCTYCHVNKDGNWDFASDEKGEKKSAREMITMVTGINKTTFKGNPEVSCYTCHRGRTSVAHTLSQPIPTPEPGPAPGHDQLSREGLPTSDQILDKYYQALGGASALDNLKSRFMKGTVTTATGTELGYELTQSGRDLILASITTPQSGIVERAFNGTVGWEKSSAGLREMAPEELTYFKRYPNLYADLKLKGQFSRLTVSGKQKLDGRDVYVLRGANVDGRREQLFFDVESGLLTRRIVSTTTLVGIIPEQIDFSDYREVDGMKLPFTIRVSAIDQNYSLVRKFTEIKINPSIDPKRFNKPG
jgi:hypothetical protein